MSVFQTYLELGFEHIISWRATDHLTFLLALCAPYALADWRRVLALVTSFTLGHSLTLALATLGIVVFPTAIIERLIPITIIGTALINLARVGRPPLVSRAETGSPGRGPISYVLAGLFGLIHGLGFSNYLRALLGAKSRPVQELLAFNVGVELGQLLVVAVIMGLALVLLRGLGVARRDWVLTSSGAALGVAVLLLLQLLSA
jgi:hypothetical protein